MRRLSWICLIVALLAQPIAAYIQGNPQVSEPKPHAIPLAVVDLQGNAVTGLGSEDVVVRGVSSQPKLTPDNRRRQIVLLFDVSVSMAPEGSGRTGKWETAQELLAQFIEVADRSLSMSLQVYAERHAVVVPATSDKKALLGALQSLPEPGSQQSENQFGKLTAFADALRSSLESGLGFGDVVVVVADSVREDNRSKTKRDAVIRMAVERGVRVYFANVEPPFSSPGASIGRQGSGVLFPTAASPDNPPRIQPYEMWVHRPGSRPESVVIRKVVEETGGQVLFIWNGATYYYPARFELPPDGLREAAREALASMSAPYRLEVRLDGPLSKKRKIEVNLMDGGKKRSDVRLYYPRQLFPAER